MIKKLLSLSENLFTKTAFLTFAFRSKCRVNKSTSCKKKPRENQYSSSSRKKTKRRPIIAPAIAVRLLKNESSQSSFMTSLVRKLRYFLIFCLQNVCGLSEYQCLNSLTTASLFVQQIRCHSKPHSIVSHFQRQPHLWSKTHPSHDNNLQLKSINGL